MSTVSRPAPGARTSGTRVTGRAAGAAGLTLAVLSAASFSTSGSFASALIDGHWSPASAVFARTAVAALLLTVPALAQLRGRWRLLRRDAGRVLGYGLIAVAGCQFCFFNAISRMPVGVALLLEFLGIVLVVLWLWVRQGQRPRKLTVAGAASALTGLVLVLNLTGPARIDPVGVLFGLLAAAGLAVYFLLSAADNDEPLPPMVMTWAGMCVGAVTFGLLGLARVVPLTAGASTVSFTGHQVSWVVPVLAIALVSTVIPYVAGIRAARRLGAKVASFVGLAEVLFAILFAWLLLGQLPSGQQFAGGGLIVIGVALVRIDELGLFTRAPVDPLPDQVGVAVVPGVLHDQVTGTRTRHQTERRRGHAGISSATAVSEADRADAGLSRETGRRLSDPGPAVPAAGLDAGLLRSVRLDRVCSARSLTTGWRTKSRPGTNLRIPDQDGESTALATGCGETPCFRWQRRIMWHQLNGGNC